MTRPRIEPQSPEPLPNTQTARPMDGKLIKSLFFYGLSTPYRLFNTKRWSIYKFCNHSYIFIVQLYF